MVYKASWTDQSNAAMAVSQAITTMDSELDSLNQQVNALSGTWDSDSKEAYLTRQKQWTQASISIKDALSDFTKRLGTTAELSQGTEKTNTTVVSG